MDTYTSSAEARYEERLVDRVEAEMDAQFERVEEALPELATALAQALVPVITDNAVMSDRKRTAIDAEIIASISPGLHDLLSDLLSERGKNWATEFLPEED